MLNGALTFINGNGQLFQPEGSDGYVDYSDDNDSQVISIAIDDDETKNVLVVGVAQDADVQRVVVGPAVGYADRIFAIDDNKELLAVGETGYLCAMVVKDDQETPVLLTQDGRNAISTKRLADDDTARVFELINREMPIAINSLTKLQNATPTGAAAQLPRVLCEIYNLDNNVVIRALHAPADDTADGGISATLYNQNNEFVYWGDQVTQLTARV